MVMPTRRLPKAILLDLDDTILDDSGNVAQCWREACEAHRPELGSIEPAALHEAIDRSRTWYWADPIRHRDGRLDMPAARREIVRLSLGEFGIEAPPLAERIAEAYGSHRDRGVQPLAHAIETVRWLRERGCKLALLTNGNGAVQRSKVDRFRLAELFEVVLIEGELGFGKPDPRVYGLALEGLGIEPTDAWMVGDNIEWDVAAPQRLGIHGIWIDVRGAGLPADSPRPDRIIRSLAELRS